MISTKTVHYWIGEKELTWKEASVALPVPCARRTYSPVGPAWRVSLFLPHFWWNDTKFVWGLKPWKTHEFWSLVPPRPWRDGDEKYY